MLVHKEKALSGETVLVLGSQGFIGKNLIQALKKSDFKVEAVSSKDLDLTDPACVEPLVAKIKACDHLVMLSCLTPDKGKGRDVLLKNILMAKHVCDALSHQDKHPQVIYFSADAVYDFEHSLIGEEIPASPIDTYGAMHRTRELMFLEEVPNQLAIIRSTLVYGPGDSHNSYGPNRFRREALTERSITIFGEGEDTRAHIFIDDLVKLTVLILQNNSLGVLNGATDESVTFGDLAKLVAELFDKQIEIKKKPRAALPNHRYFDASRCYEAFPGFTFTPLKEGLAKTYQKMIEDPHA